MRLARLAASGLIMLFLLAGCGEQKALKAILSQANSAKGAPTSKGGPIHAPERPEPKTSEEWRSEAEFLKTERDVALQTAHDADVKIEQAERRAKEQQQAEVRAEHEKEAARGRWIAGICFAVSVLAFIASFIPTWGALIPKWAGPMGMVAGVGILIAAEVWVWVANHILYLSLGAVGVGGLVTLLVLYKGTALLHIRTWFAHAEENAKTESEKLSIRAEALERELKHGVHAIGQKMRGKPLKTQSDVIKMRVAAAHAAEQEKVQ